MHIMLFVKQFNPMAFVKHVWLQIHAWGGFKSQQY